MKCRLINNLILVQKATMLELNQSKLVVKRRLGILSLHKSTRRTDFDNFS